LIFCLSYFSEKEILSEILVSFLRITYVFSNKFSEYFKEICHAFSFKNLKQCKNFLDFFFFVTLRNLIKPKRKCLDLIFFSSNINLPFFKMKKGFLKHLFIKQKTSKRYFYFDIAFNLIKVRNIPELIFKIFLEEIDNFFIDFNKRENLLEKFLGLFKIFKKKNDHKKILIIISTFFRSENETKKIKNFFLKNQYLLMESKLMDGIIRIFFPKFSYSNIKKNFTKPLELLFLKKT
jgi:hypothetical protein